MVTILLISGSSRDGSTNAAVLRTAAALAPGDVQAVLYGGIGELPLFNPDDDREGGPVDERVAAMRAAVADADAHESLRKVLGYAGAEVVNAACARIPVTREMVAPDGLLHDAAASEAILSAVTRLAEHVRAAAR